MKARFFATLTPTIFLPLHKALICPQLECAIQASSLILYRDPQVQDSVQKLAVKFVKELRHAPYEIALQRLFSLVSRRIPGDLICIYKVVHDLLDFPYDTVFTALPRSVASTTAVENPLLPTCVQRSSSPMQEQIARGDYERFISGDILVATRCTMAVPAP